jgi:hypothetical protein
MSVPDGLRSTQAFSPGETVVLGVDPSMTSTGYGVIQGGRLLDAGTIRTSARQAEPERYWLIFSELVSIIEEFSVHHVAVEEFRAFYTNKRRAAQLAAGEGAYQEGDERQGRHDRAQVKARDMFLMKTAQVAAQAAALATGCPLYLYPVQKWKGGPRVSKDAIIERAQLIYNVPVRDNDICDAVMIAHHHISSGRFFLDRGVVIPESGRNSVLRCLSTPVEVGAG